MAELDGEPASTVCRQTVQVSRVTAKAYDKFMLGKELTFFAVVVLTAALQVLGCSWDYPVWPKSKKSDTALFRFVINERNQRGGAGYIDRNGKVVIKPTLSYFGNYGDDDFFDGLAKVRLGDEQWFIDATGKPIFQTHYFNGHFSEGLASYRDEKKWGYINRQGKVAIPPVFDSAGDFSEGVALVWVNQLYGYIRKDGTIAIKPKYVWASEFSDGAARVIEHGECRYVGYGPCDPLNPTMLPYAPNSRPSPTAPRCQYSFIDKGGNRLFEGTYPDAKDFAEGLAPVGDGKSWGYIDKNGNMVIPFRYESAEPFSEGLALVQIDRKWGYIDHGGKLIIPAIFQGAVDFSEGLALVGDGADRVWFIDRTGRRAIPHVYTFASSFVMGLAHVRQGVDYDRAKWSYIDKRGKAVFTYSDQSGKDRQ